MSGGACSESPQRAVRQGGLAALQRQPPILEGRQPRRRRPVVVVRVDQAAAAGLNHRRLPNNKRRALRAKEFICLQSTSNAPRESMHSACIFQAGQALWQGAQQVVARESVSEPLEINVLNCSLIEIVHLALLDGTLLTRSSRSCRSSDGTRDARAAQRGFKCLQALEADNLVERPQEFVNAPHARRRAGQAPSAQARRNDEATVIHQRQKPKQIWFPCACPHSSM